MLMATDGHPGRQMIAIRQTTSRLLVDLESDSFRGLMNVPTSELSSYAGASVGESGGRTGTRVRVQRVRQST